MKKITLLFLLGIVVLGKTFAQCTETNEPKVLLVGDSWAWFMNTDGTINSVFKTWGHSNYKYICNSTLAVNGTQTDDVIKPATQAEIVNQLNLNPSIEVVHLSIGGNDFLGDWNRTMTQGQTDTLIDGVFVQLDSIIRFIKQAKPGIKILWSGYCYTNFKEVITNFFSPTSHPFYNTWHDMGDPDFAEINNMQNYISQRFETYVAGTTDVYYVNSNSLMQRVYGQASPLQGGLAPTGTYQAGTAPLPEGFPDFPSPRVSMRDYGITKDCYHLSPDGYRQMIGYHTQKFYHKFLMDDLYLLSENTAASGSVSVGGVVADSLVLGTSEGEQVGTVLSFNTTTMADTTLSKASLFLRRKSLTGANPIGNSLVVKVKNGAFGASANVEAADYADAGDASSTPCLFGSNTANGDWIRLDLPREILTHISNAANTQFVITSPGSTGTVVFYGTDDPDFAPVLNLKYGELPSGISEAVAAQLNVYPNPANDRLTIESGSEIINSVQVLNLLGETVLSPSWNGNSIDISSLKAGMYLVNVNTKNGTAAKLIVKE